MRISELSVISGVSPATIKFYVRSGLLPEGERAGYNRTDYGPTHVGRLRLIRALSQVGGLSISATRSVLAAIDDPELDLTAVLYTAQQATAGATEQPVAAPSADALRRVWDLVAERGWQICDSNPGVAQVARTLDAYDAAGRTDLSHALQGYAEAADVAAQHDLKLVAADTIDRQTVAGTVVVGTVLGDRLLAGLRQIAQESLTHQRFEESAQAVDESTQAVQVNPRTQGGSR